MLWMVVLSVCCFCSNVCQLDTRSLISVYPLRDNNIIIIVFRAVCGTKAYIKHIACRTGMDGGLCIRFSNYIMLA